jgi:hypothetical protein
MSAMARSLPSAQDAALILARRRTRRAPSPPPPASRALAKLLKPLDAKFGHGLEGLQARWREIVGETLAARSEPSRLIKSRASSDAALEIRVHGPSATLIQHQAGAILDRVNLFLGADAIKALRIVQAPLRGPTARPGLPARRERLRAPLDAAQERALIESLSAFPEGDLKQALQRLGREVLRAPSPP